MSQVPLTRALQFHPWDAMAPAALESIAKRGPFQFTAETGCGGSTIVLSHISIHHTVFALEGTERTITGLRNFTDFQSSKVLFVEGETKQTIPGHFFPNQLDLVLLDGPHAYPLPQLEFTYLCPHVRVGGWIVLDDIQIPSVYDLFQFMRSESSFAREEVAVRTAFFRKTAESNAEPDGWQKQGINRRGILRYSWRDQLRRLLGRA